MYHVKKNMTLKLWKDGIRMLSTIQFKNTLLLSLVTIRKDTRVLHVGIRVFELSALCAVRTSTEKGLITEHQEHSVIRNTHHHMLRHSAHYKSY